MLIFIYRKPQVEILLFGLPNYKRKETPEDESKTPTSFRSDQLASVSIPEFGRYLQLYYYFLFCNCHQLHGYLSDAGQ
jgi:hypothetical protein